MKFDLKHAHLVEVKVPNIHNGTIDYIYDDHAILIAQHNIALQMENYSRANNRFKQLGKHKGITLAFGETAMLNHEIASLFAGSTPKLHFTTPDGIVEALGHLKTPTADQFITTIKETVEQVRTLPTVELNDEDLARIRKQNRYPHRASSLAEANKRISQLEYSEARYAETVGDKNEKIQTLEKQNAHLFNMNQSLNDDLGHLAVEHHNKELECNALRDECGKLERKLKAKGLWYRFTAALQRKDVD